MTNQAFELSSQTNLGGGDEERGEGVWSGRQHNKPSSISEAGSEKEETFIGSGGLGGDHGKIRKTVKVTVSSQASSEDDVERKGRVKGFEQV